MVLREFLILYTSFDGRHEDLHCNDNLFDGVCARAKRKTSSPTLALFADTENDKLLFLDGDDSKNKTEREETYGSVI